MERQKDYYIYYLRESILSYLWNSYVSRTCSVSLIECKSIFSSVLFESLFLSRYFITIGINAPKTIVVKNTNTKVVEIKTSLIFKMGKFKYI